MTNIFCSDNRAPGRTAPNAQTMGYGDKAAETNPAIADSDCAPHTTAVNGIIPHNLETEGPLEETSLWDRISRWAKKHGDHRNLSTILSATDARLPDMHEPDAQHLIDAQVDRWGKELIDSDSDSASLKLDQRPSAYIATVIPSEWRLYVAEDVRGSHGHAVKFQMGPLLTSKSTPKRPQNDEESLRKRPMTHMDSPVGGAGKSIKRSKQLRPPKWKRNNK